MPKVNDRSQNQKIMDHDVLECDATCQKNVGNDIHNTTTPTHGTMNYIFTAVNTSYHKSENWPVV
jgi:hypothetical protein